ncbi:MAG: AraC family transcriptional regulator [Achromobacter sp.]|nr:AraC family transcriptional regulator [Achromobacter sp.]
MAARAGLATRTAQRLFREETGLGFALWRQQLRLIHALERLSAGQPVAQVADALGYDTLSTDTKEAREFAEHLALALERPRITVDLPGLTVGY